MAPSLFNDPVLLYFILYVFADETIFRLIKNLVEPENGYKMLGRKILKFAHYGFTKGFKDKIWSIKLRETVKDRVRNNLLKYMYLSSDSMGLIGIKMNYEK